MRKIVKIIIILNILFILSFFDLHLNTRAIAKSNEPPRILCLIPITEKSFQENAKIIFDTWAHDCDRTIFATKLINTTSNSNQIITVNNFSVLHLADMFEDTHGRLTDKIYGSLKHLYSTQVNDYDWYLKADDNTFIFMDHLKGFLQDKKPNKPSTYGYKLKTVFKGSYLAGGAGYVLSKKALSLVGNALSSTSKCDGISFKYEDIDLGYCLSRLGVRSGESIDTMNRERFHLLSVGDHYHGKKAKWLEANSVNKPQTGIGSISETTISFHNLKSDDMRRMGELWKAYKESQNPTKNFHQSIIYKYLDTPVPKTLIEH